MSEFRYKDDVDYIEDEVYEDRSGEYYGQPQLPLETKNAYQEIPF